MSTEDFSKKARCLQTAAVRSYINYLEKRRKGQREIFLQQTIKPSEVIVKAFQCLPEGHIRFLIPGNPGEIYPIRLAPNASD